MSMLYGNDFYIDFGRCDASPARSLAHRAAGGADFFPGRKEAVVFALLELSKQLAEQRAKTAAESHQTPATPSGMKPPYRKPPAKTRKKRPGAKQGHPGARRRAPQRIDWLLEHRADRCPDCGGKLKRCNDTRTRYSGCYCPAYDFSVRDRVDIGKLQDLGAVDFTETLKLTWLTASGDNPDPVIDTEIAVNQNGWEEMNG